MLLALFTQNANTYDEVIKDLDIRHTTGSMALLNGYKLIKGYVNISGTETAIAMISDNDVIDISRRIGRPIIYEPDCIYYGFEPGEFDGVVIILEKNFNIS